MKEEIELKLAVEPKQLLALRRSALLRTLASGRRARRQELESIYFDTGDEALRRQGMALRIRRKAGKLIQTLKAPVAAAQGGLQHMREFEVEVAHDEPDLGVIDDPDTRALLEELTRDRPLKRQFETRVVRHVLPVRLIESDIEIAFDEGKVVAGTREQRISEVELELLCGPPHYLLQLALAIGEQAQIALEPRSKAARGYLLASGGTLPAVYADKLELARDLTAGAAFEAIARDCLSQIRSNEAAFLSGNREPEVVHQLRVGVRRLRAAASLFTGIIAEGVAVQLKEELGWLQNSLGPARDWDVFRTETLAAIAHRLPDEEGLVRLGRAAGHLGEEAYGLAEETLSGQRYALLLLRLEYWLISGAWRSLIDAGDGQGLPSDQPATEFAAFGLSKRARQVMKRGKARDEAVEESLHQLRISGKKLRYALEFFRTFMKKDASKEAIGLTKELQDCLGSLNDAAVSRKLLRDLRDRFPDDADPTAIGMVHGWQAHRVDEGLSHLQDVWERARKGLKPLT